MSCGEDGYINDFEEKPAHPKSDLASMGIYIFNYQKLRSYLIEDEADPNSSKDFGKNIIPKMLENGEKMFAYGFEGYWKDVGTISSLWEANMDLLGEKPILEFDEKTRIYSRHENEAPQYIGEEAIVENSSITEGCEIYGTVINSVLGYGVVVEKGAIVRDSVLMHHVSVGEGATIEHSILDSDVKVGKGAKVGRPKEEAEGITVIGAEMSVADGEDIADNQMIYSE
jgi:glucose-1-phosphate adenylyltransferase